MYDLFVFISVYTLFFIVINMNVIFFFLNGDQLKVVFSNFVVVLMQLTVCSRHLHLENLLMYCVLFRLFLTFTFLGIKKVFKES